jgi:uncharacterized protein YutE (UPF0331/DUF86 family)
MRKQDRERLLKHLDFLKEELKDFPKFKKLERKTYFQNRDSRRNMERWVENVVNSSIDIGKILLAIKNRPIPETYREVLFNLSSLPNFTESIGEGLSRWVKLQNILAHEYLDVRWANIKTFIDEATPDFNELVSKVEALLRSNKS